MNNPMKTRRPYVWIVALLLLFPSLVLFAAPPPQGKLTGELWVTGAASVNGKTAVNGMTLLSGNRIETGPDGVVVANLGQLGRTTIQTGSDFTLDLAPNAISGNLTLGTIVINIPRGVAVKIKTPTKEVVVPADQTPATITIGITEEGTQTFLKREPDTPRAFRPFEPSPGTRSGWVFPFLAVTGLGGGAILASSLLGTSDVPATVLPETPNVTPITP